MTPKTGAVIKSPPVFDNIIISRIKIMSSHLWGCESRWKAKKVHVILSEVTSHGLWKVDNLFAN